MQTHHRPFVAILVALALLALAGCLPRREPVAPSREERAQRVLPTIPGPDDTPAPTSPPVKPGKASPKTMPPPAGKPAAKPVPVDNSRAGLIARFSPVSPKTWGMDIAGIRSRVGGKGKVIALTFDACGTNAKSSGYDAELIDFLRREQIPATLFWSAKWVDANPTLAAGLAKDALFEIENHGFTHRPCSVTARAAYGIAGTKDVGEVVDEVERGADRLQALTGRRPRFFRSGTAHYDDVSVSIIRALGHEIAGFAVNGDGGATASAANVEKAILNAPSGAIILCHMNHPEGQTAEGVMAAVPKLREKGYRFVRLADVPTR
jgi:peptidoglycan/xylan/chitin deacetylase (PgdA/CDA1 family)